MTKQKKTTSGWHPHHGGPCPVIDHDVNVLLANGTVVRVTPARLLAAMPEVGIKDDFWTGSKVMPCRRIVAYQIITYSE